MEVDLPLFFVASLVVIVAPGPDNILVLTRGISQGRVAAMISAAGASTGLVCHSILAAVGLSALLAQSALAFSLIKYAGAAYLVYLGVRTLLDRGGFAVSSNTAAVGLGSVFLQAVVSNVMNPKIAVFFLAYLPQFVAPTVDVAASRLLALGLTFALLTWVIFSVVALFSGALGNRLRDRPSLANVLRYLTSGVLVALGLRLALERR